MGFKSILNYPENHDPLIHAIYRCFCLFACFIFTEKPRIVLPSRVIRAIPEHFVWCSSEGTPPINMSLMNSSTTLAYGVGIVRSKIDHDGNYTCIATNAVGTESKKFHVSLVGKIMHQLQNSWCNWKEFQELISSCK